MRIIGKNVPNIPWQERPQDCRDVLWRYSANPILTRKSVDFCHTISNSAAVPFGDGFAGIFRCDTEECRSEIHTGFSGDGIHWNIEQAPVNFTAIAGEVPFSCQSYDPRITEIDGKYYIVWCNDNHGPTIGLAVTEDFRTFRQFDNAFLPYNRNGVLFPRKINGEYMLLSRPSDSGHTAFGDIFVSSSRDLEYWGHHRFVMGRGSGWQSLKIGPGPTPIETDEGWLLIYHGVLPSCSGYVYSFGAALLDLEEPWKVIARTKYYLMTPEAPYEVSGFVPNVVFPVAALTDAKTGRIAIYYGCADTCVGLCFGYVQEILDKIRSFPL